MVTIDDYGFLLSVRTFQTLELEAWRELFVPEHAERDLRQALETSTLVKYNFRGVAQTGLMVPRNIPGQERRLKQLRWSAEILFRVLHDHEPGQPLIEQAIREALHTYLDTERAIEFLTHVRDFTWKLIEVPAVTPFSFGIYISGIKEGMMLEDPDAAIERLFYQMNQKIAEVS